MSHLIREIESMIADYIKTKYDEDSLRNLTGMDLNRDMDHDEDATYDFSQRLLHIVMEEINWDKLVRDAQEELPDQEEEDNEDDVDDE